MSQKKNQGKQADNEEVFDLLNYKGMFFEQEHPKYIDPETGCHFEYYDLCKRLNLIRKEREKLFNELGLSRDGPDLDPEQNSGMLKE